MTLLRGGKPEAHPCRTGMKLRRFIHPQYLNCITYEPLPDLRANTRTVEIFLYLNEMPEHVTCPDCLLLELKSQLSGALLAIHANDQLPNINDASINLKPGSLTEVRIATFENVQKLPPHGQCDLNVPSSLHLYDSDYVYSEHGCLEAARQSAIIQQCGCYAIESPYNELDGIPPCGNLPSFVNLSTCKPSNLLKESNNSGTLQCIENFKQFAKRIHCKQRVLESYDHGNKTKCAMPCSFYSYETALSTSSWPTKTMQLTWLNSSFGRELGYQGDSRFSVYKQAQAAINAGKLSLADEILTNTNILERNLVAVLINRPNSDVHKVEEKEVLSMTSMLSQTGGLFSMWMGLTFISVGEILELIARCVKKIIRYVSGRRSSLPETVNQHHAAHQEANWTAPELSTKNVDVYDPETMPESRVDNQYMSKSNCCCCLYVYSCPQANELGCNFPLIVKPSERMEDDPNTTKSVSEMSNIHHHSHC